MANFKLIIQYDGTKYNGWQKQGNTPNTIQGKLETLLERLLSEPVAIHGSGRTDAGVHALGQTANFHSETSLTPEQLKDTMNQYLPRDIRIAKASYAAPRFHARLQAQKKHYRYTIDQNSPYNVFTRNYALALDTPLNIEAMEKAASYLLGEHDFKSFCGNKHMKKSTVRKIHSITFTKNQGMLYIDYRGNGFLQYMIRIITGTLLEVGMGKIPPEEMKRILERKNRTLAGAAVPAHGLCLVEVIY